MGDYVATFVVAATLAALIGVLILTQALFTLAVKRVHRAFVAWWARRRWWRRQRALALQRVPVTRAVDVVPAPRSTGGVARSPHRSAPSHPASP
jgi:hypothetical protein